MAAPTPDGEDLAAGPDRPPLNILIVEDHHMVSQLLASHLAKEPDLNIVMAVSTVAEARRLLASCSVDIVLMDYLLPDGNGINAASRLLTLYPKMHVILVTAVEDPELLQRALRIGCSGYVSKAQDIGAIVSAIRSAIEGLVVAPTSLQHMAGRLIGGDIPNELSDREQSVLELLADGMSTKEVAEALFISANTVRNHIQRSLTKLEARTRLEAVVKARKLGILSASKSKS